MSDNIGKNYFERHIRPSLRTSKDIIDDYIYDFLMNPQNHSLPIMTKLGRPSRRQRRIYSRGAKKNKAANPWQSVEWLQEN